MQTKEFNKMYHIYTDGGCVPNPGIGSWAFVVYLDNRHIETVYGFSPDTTNNRMELTAILEAIRKYYDKNIIIHSDSELCVNTINTWMYRWEKKNFKKKKNVDLVKQLIELKRDNHKIVHVKGHSGIIGNEVADQTCTQVLANKLDLSVTDFKKLAITNKRELVKRIELVSKQEKLYDLFV